METTTEQTATTKRNNDEKIIIYFGASWCGPCRTITPVVEKLAETINIIKVDVDECPTLATEASIRAVPTFIRYDKGVKIGQLIGGKQSEEILALYNQ